MRRVFFILIFAIFSTCNPASPLAKGSASELQQQDNPQVSEQEPEAERDATEYHFHLAGTSYADNDFSTSAEQIRRAAESLKKQLGNTDQELRPLFSASIVEMEMAAGNVERGRVKSVRQLHEIFARAETALAKHHIKQAQTAWESQNVDETARKLTASANNLENAMVRTSYQDDGTLGKILSESKRLSKKLLQEGAANPGEINESIIDMNVAIGKFEILSAAPPKK